MEKPVALLINPPIYDFALFDLFHKPFGLLRIGKWLEESGYQVVFVDALDYEDTATVRKLGAPLRRGNGTGKFSRQPVPFPAAADIRRGYARYGILEESLRRKIREARPDIVLVGSGMTYWYPGVVEAVRHARELHGKVPIFVGGVYASLLPDHCSRVTSADFVISGNPWPRLAHILQSMNLPAPSGPPGKQVLQLENVWKGAGVVKLNEGCPMKCRYCASHLLSPELIRGNPVDGLNYLKLLLEIGRVRFAAFYDDALLSGKEEVLLPFLEGVIEADLNVDFYLPNAIHLRYLDLEAAGLMKRAGFREIRLGYESSSIDFHSRHDSKVVSGEFEEGLSILKEAGFLKEEIIAYILAGMPGQSAAEVEESVRFVSSFGIRASIAEYSPVPHTGLWEKSVELSRYPIADEPLFQNNSLFPMEWDGFSSVELRRLKILSRELID